MHWEIVESHSLFTWNFAWYETLLYIVTRICSCVVLLCMRQRIVFVTRQKKIYFNEKHKICICKFFGCCQEFFFLWCLAGLHALNACELIPFHSFVWFCFTWNCAFRSPFFKSTGCVCARTLYSVLTLESHPSFLLLLFLFSSRIVSSMKEFLVYRFFFPLPVSYSFLSVFLFGFTLLRNGPEWVKVLWKEEENKRMEKSVFSKILSLKWN